MATVRHNDMQAVREMRALSLVAGLVPGTSHGVREINGGVICLPVSLSLLLWPTQLSPRTTVAKKNRDGIRDSV